MWYGLPAAQYRKHVIQSTAVQLKSTNEANLGDAAPNTRLSKIAFRPWRDWCCRTACTRTGHPSGPGEQAHQVKLTYAAESAPASVG